MILIKQCSKLEKQLLVGFLIILAIASFIFIKNKSLKNSIPNFGGTYTEGIVASTDSELSETLDSLTKIGLTSFSSDGKIIPDLAESWQISADGLSYVFKIRNIITADEVIKIIKDNKKEWNDISLTKIDDRQIKFELKQPLGPFLARTTEPMYPYGPYKINKTTKSEVVLDSNKNYWEKTPYINKIILKLYNDDLSLQEALKRKEIMGGLLTNNEDIGNFKKIEFNLPKYKMVFFNLTRQPFSDKDLRKKIVSGENLGSTVNAHLALIENENDLILAGDLIEKWSALGLKVTVDTYSASTLQKEVIPNKDYDILLYGIDYGVEEDPYPYFHSSQNASGSNFSGFVNKNADKILEDARLTTDETERFKKYEEFKKIFNEEVPAMVVKQEKYSYYISDQIKGISELKRNSNSGDRFNSVDSWYIKEKKVK